MKTCIWLACMCLVLLSFAGRAFAQVATYPFGVSDWVEDPSHARLYGAVPSENAVAVFNSNTLQLVTTVFVGSDPRRIALSPDGSRLYSANAGSNFIGIVDTSTLTALPSFPVPAGNPFGVQFGTNNRLWVDLGSNTVQLDATTGASTGSPLPHGSGDMRITPDRSTLFFADEGSSPSFIQAWNVTGSAASLDWSVAASANGFGDEQISHNGTLVMAPGGGTGSMPFLRTSDHLSVGSLTPAERFAFSPDDIVGYAATGSSITVYNMNTFLSTATISTGFSQSGLLFVDSTGRYLFDTSLSGTSTAVFSTGRSVPEPAGVIGMVAAMPLLLSRGTKMRRRNTRRFAKTFA